MVKSFLDLWVAVPTDEIAKNWVACALVEAFPDPWISGELTHAREALVPIYGDLLERAARCRGRVPTTKGRTVTEPLFALAAEAASAKFVKSGDADSRKLLFQILVEIVAAEPKNANDPAITKYARALRIEIQELAKNPTARPAIPVFQSARDVIPWFSRQRDRYHSEALAAWQHKLSAWLCYALDNRAPMPMGALDEDGEVADGVDGVLPSGFDTEEGSDDVPPPVPPSYWLLPDDSFTTRAKWGARIKEEMLVASVSTYIPLARFTESSPSYLADEGAVREAMDCLREGDDCGGDRMDLERRAARALSLTTATPMRHLHELRWGDDGGNAPRQYPGLLSPDGHWLFRPELGPKEGGLIRDRWVHIPLPDSLSRLLLRLRPESFVGRPVFAREAVINQGGDAVALHRALISRLVKNERFGPSLAQYVAGDDLGIDVAPLHYDRILTADIAMAVSQVTFPWFGEKPGRGMTRLPKHWVGSRRVPDLSLVRQSTVALHRAWKASDKDLVDRISFRTRNLVFGLILQTGHRPNDRIQMLRIHDVGVEDPVAILVDKVAGPEWAARPVALAERWQEEYRQLLADLAKAAAAMPTLALGQAAAAALAGNGPVFLTVHRAEAVEPFSARDYLDGLPASLRDVPNWARHFLNSELSKCLPEALRVAQLGWHGTRGGVFEDASPWSVMSACRQISPLLAKVLRTAKWRPLHHDGCIAASPLVAQGWRDVERDHIKRFKGLLASSKDVAAKRKEEMMQSLEPKLGALLRRGRFGLQLLGDKLELLPGTTSPVDVPAGVSEMLIQTLAGGDSRTLEAHAARALVRKLLEDARRRHVITGQLPRESRERWASHPGSFMRGTANALATARRLDAAITQSKPSAALKVVGTLLLHGGYADIEAVLAAMAPGARVSRLQSDPRILLVEPPAPAPISTADDGWTHGTLAFHGLAALALWAWHRSSPKEAPALEILDKELAVVGRGCLEPSHKNDGGLVWIRDLESLALACNSLRMDGWARPVGTRLVRPTGARIERVVAIRDDLPLGPRSHQAAKIGLPSMTPPKSARKDRTHGLLQQLTSALSEAVERVSANRQSEAAVRSKLEQKIRRWVGAAEKYRSDELVALYALLLLLHGGQKLPVLALTTIRGYVYDVGKPLVRFLADDPLAEDSNGWTDAFMAAVVDADVTIRASRANALSNFHSTLSQAMAVPEVDFGEVFALAGRAVPTSAAGFLTSHEVAALSWALGQDLIAATTLAAEPKQVELARQRRVLGGLMLAGALRPGEGTRLVLRDLSVRDGEPKVTIRRTSHQRLKNTNARRNPRLLDSPFPDVLEHAQRFEEDVKKRMGPALDEGNPLFHRLDSPAMRTKDQDLIARLSGLIKWSTGELAATAYWLRKTGVRYRLEDLMSNPDRSLWPSRRLLAEIGHGSNRVTLGSYVHDPVTPFLRWFNEKWCAIDADRIADAACRSLSVVARARGGRRLKSAHHAVMARVSELIQDAPHLDLPDKIGDELVLPEPLAIAASRPVTASDVDRVLRLHASGLPIEIAAALRSWPERYVVSLARELNTLRREYSVAIVASAGESKGVHIAIPIPRQLAGYAGILELLNDDGETGVIAQLAMAWVSSLPFGKVDRIPARVSEWDRWFEASPTIARLCWETQQLPGVLVSKTPTSGEAKKPGPWPTLRWAMVCAWLQRRLRTNHTE